MYDDMDFYSEEGGVGIYPEEEEEEELDPFMPQPGDNEPSMEQGELFDPNKVYPPGHLMAPTPYSQPGYEQWYNDHLNKHGAPPTEPPPTRDFTMPPEHPAHKPRDHRINFTPRIEEDPFDPYAEEPEPPWGLQPDEADIADLNMQTDKYSSYGNPDREGPPQAVDPEWYERGMLDAPEYWNNPSIMGQGIGRPELQRNWPQPSGTQQEIGFTPPYGTRREPGVNSVAQDPRDINQFIRQSLQQQEYANMPSEARDVHEQIDMIRGAAPRMRPQDIQQFLEEQMRGQGYMLPPRPEDAIPPEYEEDVFRGRRFGRR